MDLQSLLDGPSLAAPLGVPHNFVNPANMAIESHAVFTTCLVVSALAVGMRMWTKTRLVRKVVLEDCKSFHLCFETRGLTISGICCLALVRFFRYHYCSPNLNRTGSIRSILCSVLACFTIWLRGSSMACSAEDSIEIFIRM